MGNQLPNPPRQKQLVGGQADPVETKSWLLWCSWECAVVMRSEKQDALATYKTQLV